MSSPGSVALTLDLPRRFLSDRITVGLCLACVPFLETAAGRHPNFPVGIGLCVGALLLASQWAARVGQPAASRAILAESGAWQFDLADGRRVPAMLLPGSRALGPTLLLRWRIGERTVSRWFTRFDVPTADLRRITARLRATPSGQGA
jgi:hypothetical protein